MMYSVWDHARREYDYYSTPELSAATQSPKPKHLSRSSHKLGMTPEEAAWPLPANASKAGSGKYPKGFIAHPKTGLGALGFLPSFSPTNLILMGIGGYAFWKYVLKGK